MSEALDDAALAKLSRRKLNVLCPPLASLSRRLSLEKERRDQNVYLEQY